MDFREVAYPLGLTAHIFFGLRMTIQWFLSEMKKQSFVPPIFWNLSLAGSLILVLQGIIQVQYHVAITHGLNSVLFWRNLNLLKPSEKHVRFTTVLMVLFVVFLSTTTFFFLLEKMSEGPFDWFQVPKSPVKDFFGGKVPFAWHILGFVGLGLFSLRFWVQWISCERHKVVNIGISFWWMSLAAALIVVIYFGSIGDIVNMIGPLLGSIIYIRNLFLFKKVRKNKVSH